MADVTIDEKLVNDIKTLSASLSDVATKAELKTFSEATTKMLKDLEMANKGREAHPIFETKAKADVFVDTLALALKTANKAVGPGLIYDAERATNRVKAAGDPLESHRTDAGVDLVPRVIADGFSKLVLQNGVARRESKVFYDVQGDLDIVKKNGTCTAVFTAADDSVVNPTQMGTGKLSLSPRQISVISLASDRLLYSSSVNLAQEIFLDQAEQCGVLEDVSILIGDGSPTYGNITGIKNAAGVPNQTVTVANYGNSGNQALTDALLGLPALVAEQVRNSENAKYYVSSPLWQSIKNSKSAQGQYNFDLQTGKYLFGGYEVVLWNRIGTAVTAGNMVGFFGDMKAAVTIGIGRDQRFAVDSSYAFNKNQTAFRTTYDFAGGIVQPTALAKLSIIA